MINAFRHQRFLHCALRRTVSAASERDQRLSASKIFALAITTPKSGGSQSDQRLSASKIFARTVTGLLHRRLQRVINAFRHQRFLHGVLGLPNLAVACDQRLSASKIFALAPFANKIGLWWSVINAFRHQRFLHDSVGFYSAAHDVG